jgi:hypothetical protein
MKFTVGEILMLKDNLKKLSEIKDVPAIVGFRLAAMLRKFNEPIADAEKARVNLIQKFGGPADEDSKVTVLPENMSKFLAELTEMMNEELDLEIKTVAIPSDTRLPDLTTLVGLEKIITVIDN